MSLQTILRGANTSSHPVIIFQSSATQSSLPLLRSLLGQIQTRIVICNLLYPKKFLVDGLPHDQIEILDCTADVPGFSDSAVDGGERLLSAINSAVGLQPLTIVIDSLDTLLSNLSSKAAVYAYLRDVLHTIRTRASSRLVIHTLAPSALPLIPLLTSTTFSPTLVHITAHPPILLTHLATSLSTLPPPLSSAEKFWNVFLPVAGRTHDIEDLVFGSDGEGSAPVSEIVVEVLVRGSELSEGAVGRRKKGVERTLEGWICNRGVACELKDLPSLQNLFMNKSGFTEPTAAPDPTQNLSFNLTLTPEQQQSRTKVPLPYAHTGTSSVPSQQAGAILYDPDSADDIDDDDPDEDLDI